jgi:hypothetical protein
VIARDAGELAQAEQVVAHEIQTAFGDQRAQ